MGCLIGQCFARAGKHSLKQLSGIFASPLCIIFVSLFFSIPIYANIGGPTVRIEKLNLSEAETQSVSETETLTLSEAETTTLGGTQEEKTDSSELTKGAKTSSALIAKSAVGAIKVEETLSTKKQVEGSSPLNPVEHVTRSVPQSMKIEVSPEEMDHVDLQRWTLEEKIGQLLLIGYRSEQQVLEIKPAGLVFFSWSLKNPAQTEKLLRSIKENPLLSNRAPLFLATDHEGGRVLRLRKGLTPFPDAAAIGSLIDPEMAFQVGRSMGLELSSLGFNMNLAPVLDLGNARSFLANRVWGEDPLKVSEMTMAYIQGLHASRILSVGKHFPGHGSSQEDSHFSLPVILKSEQKLWEQDLVPFKNAVEMGLSAVMTAHVEIPSVDRGPASLSKKFVTTILKEKIGFRGLVITDDLEMGGLAQQLGYTPQDLALKALLAGSDMVLVVWSEGLQRKVVDRVRLALKNGEINEEWLDQKVKKIAAFKKKLLGDGQWSNPFWKHNLRRPASLQLSELVTKEAIQWVGGQEDLLRAQFNAQEGAKWLCLMPSENWASLWKQTRSQDDVLVLQKFADQAFVKRVKDSVSAAVMMRQPLLIVTPPRALGSEELFTTLRKELGDLVRRKKITSPIIWAHQGATPIKLQWSAERLPMGLVSLHSGSLGSLRALMTKLMRKKNNRGVYRSSKQTALMEPTDGI